MSKSTKELSKKIQTILKAQGHEVQLGHCYELMAQIAGYPSWNVAAAANLRKSKTDDPADALREEILKDAKEIGLTPFACTMVASATVRFSQTRFAKTENEAKLAFEKDVKEGYERGMDIEVVEPPMPEHDYSPDQIEAEVDTSTDMSRVVMTYKGSMPRVPGAVAFVGEGKETYEAKIVTQVAEAKIYVEVRADSEAQARETVEKWLDEKNVSSPPTMQIAVDEREYIPALKDWEVIWLEQLQIQHIQKR